LVRADFGEDRRFRRLERSPLGDVLAGVGRSVVAGDGPATIAFPIRNTDRSVGTRLAGEVAEATNGEGLPDGSLTVRLAGTAGQSFGAFLISGIDLDLAGAGNDYVGKGMGGGSISIRPHATGSKVPHAAGNACLYGATGGSLFAAGSVGQRFAVRNSGATAVVEGTSDHLAEYMTGGTVAVLGPTGRNIGAGMTGGVLFLYDPTHAAKSRVSDSAPSLHRLAPSDADILKALVIEHVDRTGSASGQSILDGWDSEVDRFWVLRPEAPEWIDPSEQLPTVSISAPRREQTNV
jgi:glutamate synthase domain-containing protein 3